MSGHKTPRSYIRIGLAVLVLVGVLTGLALQAWWSLSGFALAQRTQSQSESAATVAYLTNTFFGAVQRNLREEVASHWAVDEGSAQDLAGFMPGFTAIAWVAVLERGDAGYTVLAEHRRVPGKDLDTGALLSSLHERGVESVQAINKQLVIISPIESSEDRLALISIPQVLALRLWFPAHLREQYRITLHDCGSVNDSGERYQQGKAVLSVFAGSSMCIELDRRSEAIAGFKGVVVSVVGSAALLSLALLVLAVGYFRLQHLRDSLSLSNAKMELLFNSISEGVVQLDRGGNIVTVNPVGAALLGTDPASLVGQAWLDYLILPEDTAEGADFAVLARNRLGESSDAENAQTDVRRADGRSFPSELSFAQMREGKHIAGYVVVFSDVSYRMQREEMLRDHNEALERINEELQQFTYMASHDLREPLRSIRSFLQLMERKLPEDVRRDVDVETGFIKSGVLRMSALLDGLLELSRTGRRRMNWHQLSLRESYGTVCESLHSLIEESGVELSVTDLDVVFDGDSVLISHALQNLVENAIKYRRPEVPARVEVSGRRVADGVEIVVRDNGIGIASEKFDSIFEPFRRLHGREQYWGTGIGLAIVQRVVRRHGGTIVVESEVNEGSRFRVFLPDYHQQEPTV